MSLAVFVRENRPWLAAGLVLTFSSSFGQTWFIALFGAEIRGALGLSDGAWGALYSLGTTASATLLIVAGGLADRFRARALALAVLACFAAACVAMAHVDSVAMLGVVIFVLRFCGQGMMSQIAMTAMARWFRAQRGRALAVAGLGYSLGESMLPTLAVGLAGLVGWRNTWLAAAGLLVLLAPLLLRLLADERTPRDWAETSESLGLDGRHWTRAEALRHWMFWPVTLGVLGPPLIGTAVFFQQARLAEAKDLALGAVAGAYPVYAAVTIMASFTTGWVVDRLSARVLLPVYQVPMAVGCLLLAVTAAPWTVPVAFALFGLTQGAAVALLGALWPELYGTRHVGAIRGTAVSTMVYATALGPVLTGGLLDLGIGIEAQFAGLAVVQAGLCVMFGRVALEALRRRAAAR